MPILLFYSIEATVDDLEQYVIKKKKKDGGEVTMFSCSRCGGLFSIGSWDKKLWNRNGHHPSPLCEGCKNSVISKCSICDRRYPRDMWGGLFPINDFLKHMGLPPQAIYDGALVGSTRHYDPHYNSNNICPECAIPKLKHCSYCSRPYLGQAHEEGICDRCAQLTYKCQKCGKRDMHPNPYEEGKFCKKCKPVYEMKPWDFKAKKIHFHGDGGKERLFYGIEVEIHTPAYDPHRIVHNLWKKTNGGLKHYYFQWDGSINPGFEVVFMPRDWASLQTYNFQWLYDLEQFRSDRHPHQGIHIHLSRTGVSPYHAFKMATFIYSNVSFISFIGERVPTQYSNTNLDVKLSKAVREEIGCAGPHQHHDLYNFKRRRLFNNINPKTVELRFFNTTLVPWKFWKNLEFSKAITEFTKNAGMEELTFNHFLFFLEKNQERYQNLYRFCTSWVYDDERKILDLRYWPRYDKVRVPQSRREWERQERESRKQSSPKNTIGGQVYSASLIPEPNYTYQDELTPYEEEEVDMDNIFDEEL